MIELTSGQRDQAVDNWAYNARLTLLKSVAFACVQLETGFAAFYLDRSVQLQI